MPEGAVDHDFDDAERPPAARLAESFEDTVGDRDTHRDLSPGDYAIDLVTRQLLYITDQPAESLVEYYDEEDFDLASYKQAPWLPVRSNDPVFTCEFVSTSIKDVHKAGDSGKDYDYPAGRLAGPIPLEELGDRDA